MKGADMLKPPVIESVPRLETVSVEEFWDRFGHPGKPVVLSNALGWPALRHWSHRWFKENFADTPVELSVNPTHTYKVVRSTIGAYIDRITSNLRMEGGLYMDQFPVARLPDLARDFSTPEFCKPGRRVMTHLWLGPGTTLLSFHKDNNTAFTPLDNVFVQIVGRKRILLASPENDEFMYPRPPEVGAYWHSLVDPENPDLATFPRFAEARLLEAVVGPGELLYIPRDYWHHVRALEPSISMSFWWFPSKLVEVSHDVLSMSANQFEDFVLGDRPTITAQDLDEYGGADRLSAVLRETGDIDFVRRLLERLMVLADPDTRVRLGSILEEQSRLDLAGA